MRARPRSLSRFKNEYTLGPTKSLDGYDGANRWRRDISGTVTLQQGVDSGELAVNEVSLGNKLGVIFISARLSDRPLRLPPFSDRRSTIRASLIGLELNALGSSVRETHNPLVTQYTSLPDTIFCPFARARPHPSTPWEPDAWKRLCLRRDALARPPAALQPRVQGRRVFCHR
jgi:hypothetical protein